MESNRKSFWSLLSAKLRGFGKWLIGAIAALAVLIIALIGVHNSDDNNNSDTTNNKVSKPEVAQVYEPSISTPLPPDTTPSDNSNTTTPSDSGTVAGATDTYIAPKTGINDSDPIKYENSNIHFTAILPPHTKVKESNSSVSFYSVSGQLLYQVDVVKAKSDLQQIFAQINTSPEVININQTNFADKKAIKFTTKNSVGYALVTTDQIYYLTGYEKFLKDITI